MELGKHHPTVRRLRGLRRDAGLRRAEGVFLAEGIHLAQEVLTAGARVELAVVSGRLVERDEGRALRQALDERRFPLVEVADGLLDSLQDAHSPQPVLLVVEEPVHSLEPLLAACAGAPLLAVAHALQDPGNLGAVLRTAHAAGATAGIVCGDSVDPFHPRAVRASMGSIVRLPVVRESPERLLGLLREYGIVAAAAEPKGRTDYTRADLTRPLALFLGREGQGLPAELLARMDETLRVPMHPGVESLSVVAAAAVLLFESARQRRDTR